MIGDVPPEHRLSSATPTFRANLLVPEGARANTAVLNLEDGVVLQELPFDVELKKFIVEYYATGMPKLFASEIVIHDHQSGAAIPATVKVNEPAHHRGVVDLPEQLRRRRLERDAARAAARQQCEAVRHCRRDRWRHTTVQRRSATDARVHRAARHQRREPRRQCESERHRRAQGRSRRYARWPSRQRRQGAEQARAAQCRAVDHLQAARRGRPGTRVPQLHAAGRDRRSARVPRRRARDAGRQLPLSAHSGR